MTKERYKELNNSTQGSLTTKEVNEGWHWCDEWDGLLVGPGMSEMNCCSCFEDDKFISIPFHLLKTINQMATNPKQYNTIVTRYEPIGMK
jgi:hypothetical protein